MKAVLIFKEAVIFLKKHWIHGLLMIPGAFLIIFIHEAMHGLAVLWQGGVIKSFNWIPGSGVWGQIRYALPINSPTAQFYVSIAPYGLSLLLLLLGMIISFIRPTKTILGASFQFVWLFVVPLGDIFYVLLPYLFSTARNDFSQAFGPPTYAFSSLAILWLVAAVMLGFLLQKRLYQTESIDFPAYVLIGGLLAFILSLV